MLAYREIEKEGITGKQRKKIYSYLKKLTAGRTRNELRRELKIPINAVCGRVNELLRLGKIIEIGQRRDLYTNKMNYIVGVR